jgi:hypothetical protein
VIVADFNRDGKDDIAVGFGHLSVSLGRGDGTFHLPVISQLIVFSFLPADLNRDGLPDLVTQSGTALGKGDGSFEPVVRFIIPEAMSDVGIPLAAADFTGDGTVDLAVSNSQGLPGAIWIIPGKGDGTFGPPMKQTVGGISGWGAAADLDGDGRLDLATLNHLATLNKGSNTISLLLSGIGNRDSLVRAVSAASGTAIVAPGSLAVLYTSIPAANPETAGAPPWPAQLAGLRLEVRDNSGASLLAPLIYVSETQINFLVPPETALGEAALFILGDTGSKPAGTMQVDAVAPGVFCDKQRLCSARGW